MKAFLCPSRMWNGIDKQDVIHPGYKINEKTLRLIIDVRLMDGWLAGWHDGWMGGGMDEGMDGGREEEWMNGLMVLCVCVCVCVFVVSVCFSVCLSVCLLSASLSVHMFTCLCFMCVYVTHAQIYESQCKQLDLTISDKAYPFGKFH